MTIIDRGDIIAERRGALGILTLNRSKALNALTLGMVGELLGFMRVWRDDDGVEAVLLRSSSDRAFCAGGDVRALAAGTEEARSQFFTTEYTLNHLIHTYPKPVIALLDGLTMGGGCGLALHASHPVATERTIIAMPETSIGLFPDIGATWFLNRLPGEMGVYLGLTGVRIAPADIVALGVTRHFVPSAHLAEIASIGDLDRLSEPVTGAAEIAARRSRVDALFAGATIAEIATALTAAPEDWAQDALRIFGRVSPTSLAVTLEQLRGGRGLAIADIFRREYRLATRATAYPDFREGVRAMLVDKDNAPRWQKLPDAAAIGRFFAPMDDGAELWKDL